MSEPTPEAKQEAVQDAMAELGRIGNRRTIKEILESLYDTATAKLREALLDLAESSAKKTAKLWKELAYWKERATVELNARHALEEELLRVKEGEVVTK